MREVRNGTLALIILAVCAPTARSGDSDRMVPEEGAVHVMLLRQKCVREELKLTDDEARKVKEHNNRE
jgi:hypothetical protein